MGAVCRWDYTVTQVMAQINDYYTAPSLKCLAIVREEQQIRANDWLNRRLTAINLVVDNAAILFYCVIGSKGGIYAHAL
jgi:hypothetical protein